jgi:DNA-binding beta-propeller fold protein YncE
MSIASAPLIALFLVTASLEAGPFSFQVGGLASPASAAIDDKGYIFVVEEVGCRVRVFGPEGAPRRSWGSFGSAPGQFSDPRGMTLGPDGNVYVSDTGNHRVQVFEPDGTFVRVFGRRGTQPGSFHDPLGLAVDSERIYVADSGNDRVQIFLLDGTFEREIGGFGREPGQFNQPVDVDVDRDGSLFVADRNNHRIQSFEADGTFRKAWGDKGPYLGLFAAPTGVLVYAGRVYVADSDNHRIQVFDRNGKVVDEWGLHALAPRQGEGRFHYPNQFAVAPSGKFCVVIESFEDRFQVFVPGERPERTSVDAVNQSASEHFGRMVSARGRVCAIAEPARPSVLIYECSGETPIRLTAIARHGRKFGQLLAPVDAEVHPTKDMVVVADPGTARLSFFRLDLPPADALKMDPLMSTFVRSLDLVALSADPQWNAVQPIQPGALEYDKEGNLWLLDPRASRIVVISPDLTILRVFGDPKTLRGPTDLALSRDGETVYVVDAGARRIQVFDREGEATRTFGRPVGEDGEARDDRFVRPFGVHAGDDGFVYVTDQGAESVVKFDERGSFVSRFGSDGLKRAEFKKPAGLAQDGQGRLFVLDHGNHRAQVFHPAGGFVAAIGPFFFIRSTK